MCEWWIVPTQQDSQIVRRWTKVMIDASALERLRAVVGDDPADLIDIISSFLEEAPTLLQAMTQAADAADLATVHRLAHSLKSNARDLGASRLGELCQALENELRSGRTPEDLKARVDEVVAAWDEVKPAMLVEIERIGCTP